VTFVLQSKPDRFVTKQLTYSELALEAPPGYILSEKRIEPKKISSLVYSSPTLCERVEKFGNKAVNEKVDVLGIVLIIKANPGYVSAVLLV
jgi:hypothetical protein